MNSIRKPGDTVSEGVGRHVVICEPRSGEPALRLAHGKRGRSIFRPLVEKRPGERRRCGDVMSELRLFSGFSRKKPRRAVGSVEPWIRETGMQK